jgi:uncharacterized membrane protein YccF (DUF307 family)
VVHTLGNVLWLLLAGVWVAAGYALSGWLLCLTIIGIPFGIQAFKLSVLALWPFGRNIVMADSTRAPLGRSFAVPGH